MITKLLIYKILQLFCFMIIGFILAKMKVVKYSDSSVLSKLSLYLLMPSAIINSFDFERSSAVIKGLILAFAAAIIVHIVFLCLDGVHKKFITANAVDRASVMYPNAGNIIIPIVTFVLGGEWVVYSTAFLSVQLIFLWSHGMRIFAPAEKFNFKKVIFNVNIIAIVIGIAMMAFGVRLPVFVKDITSTFGSMLGAVGMLIAGILAANIDFKKILKDKRIYRVMITRTVIYPVITLALLKLMSGLPVVNGGKIMLIVFLATITPSAASVMQFAQIKENESDYAAAINIFTTVAAVLTMPLFVMLFNL